MRAELQRAREDDAGADLAGKQSALHGLQGKTTELGLVADGKFPARPSWDSFWLAHYAILPRVRRLPDFLGFERFKLSSLILQLGHSIPLCSFERTLPLLQRHSLLSHGSSVALQLLSIHLQLLLSLL